MEKKQSQKSNRETIKNEKELSILEKAIENGINSEEEETRKICLCLSHSEIVPMEVPDFTMVNKEEKLYFAVEHFRVDHQIRKQHGKIGAASIKFQANNEKIRQKYKDDVSNNLLNIMDELNKNIEGQLNRTFNAPYEDLLKSFKYSLSNHVPRIDIYKEKYRDTKFIDYAFKAVMLIEVVTDFSRLYNCSYRKTKRNYGGLMPIFDDVIDILSSEDCKDVDYYVLYLTSYFGEITKTIALDNSCIKDSLKRNRIKQVHNCSYEKFLVNDADKAVDLTIGKSISNGDKIDSLYSINYRTCNNELFIPAVQSAAKEALALRSRREEFTTDYCTLFFIEVYGENIRAWRRYKNTDLYIADIVIEKMTETRRIRKFDKNYPIERIY